MTRPVLLSALIALCFASGCAIQLSSMAKSRAKMDLGCDPEDLEAKMKADEPPYSKWRVTGCGRWVEYRGTCESRLNDCDAVDPDPMCDKGCNLDRIDSGELEVNEDDGAGGDAK